MLEKDSNSGFLKGKNIFYFTFSLIFVVAFMCWVSHKLNLCKPKYMLTPSDFGERVFGTEFDLKTFNLRFPRIP